MDSLNVFKIVPIEFEKGRKRIHIYKRVKVKELSKKTLLSIYTNLNFKALPSIIELPETFIIQYKSKPVILISKQDGQLYAFKGKWDMKEIQHQASLLIRVLSRVELVEEHKRICIQNQKRNRNGTHRRDN